MANETALKNELENEKAEKSEWMKRVVPIILLLFVLLLVAGVALSSPLGDVLGSGNIVVFVLTALLCTLVAVSLMLTGLSEWFRKIEENAHSLATDAVMTRVEQHRMNKANLNSNEQVEAKISLIEENQRLLREVTEDTSKQTNDKIAVLSESQQRLQTDVKDLSEKTNSFAAEVANLTTQQTTINEVLKTHLEASDAQMSALATSHGQLETNLESLRELAQTIADGAANAANEQSALHGLVQGNTQIVTDNIQTIEKNQEILQTMMNALDQKATEMAAENANSHQAVSKKNEELTDKIGTLFEGQQAFHNGVTGLSEKISQLTQEVEHIIAEQVELSGTFRDHAEALNAQMSTLNTNHERCDIAVHNLHGLTQTVAETSQQIAEATAAIAKEQAALHETVTVNNEEHISRLSTLSEDQQNIHTGIGTLDERIAKISAGIDSITEEQTHLHQYVQNSKNELADRMGVAAQDMEKLQAGIYELHKAGKTLSDTARALATLQETLTQAIKQAIQKTADPLASLSSDHGHFQNNSRNRREENQKLEFEEKDLQALTAMADFDSQIQESLTRPQTEMRPIEGAIASKPQSKILPVISESDMQSY